jgi:nicotinate-nucleotide adenylyltransferase
MVRLACAADSRFEASDLDAPRPDGTPNFTVDTLARLTQQMPGARIFAIAGADSFQSLGHWREPRRLLQLAEWIVVSRPGFALPERVTPEGMTLAVGEQARIHPLRSLNEDVAATSLRERLHRGDPCADLLPEPVAADIAQTGLYR